MTAEIIPLAAFRAEGHERKSIPIGPPANMSAPISTPTTEWLKAHPRFFSDAAYNSAAQFGHHHALRCGITADTPSYFAHVEYFTGDRELPEGCARPCDQIEHGGKSWLVWDVTRDLQPIVVMNGRKQALMPNTWTRLGDAVKRALEELGR
jgi:hypothetical protein